MIAIYQHRDAPARLGRLARPVLLVVGEGTDRYNVAVTEALAGSVPSARVVQLPGGHMAPVASKDRFLEEIEAFQRAAEQK